MTHALTIAALMLASPAQANGYSADVELIRPVPGAGSMSGLPGFEDRRTATVSWSLHTAYSANPLVLVEEGVEVGNVVASRVTAFGNIAVTAADGLTLDAQLPLAMQFGSTAPDYSADGFGIGDAFVGATYTTRVGPTRSRWKAGFRTEVGIPLGTQEKWLAESTLRFGVSGLLRYAAGPWEVLLRSGFVLREKGQGPEDFRVGRELRIDPGLRWWANDELGLYAHVAMVAHPALDGPLLAVEPVLGAQWRKGAHMLGLGVGRGVTGGIGASDGRVVFTLMRTQEPPAPAPPPTLVVYDPADDLADYVEPEVVEVAAPPPPPPPPMALVVKLKLLEIGERIQFKQDAAELTPHGWVAVAEVGRLMADQPVTHLVIEGHASAEGDEEHNWDLSQRRGRAVYEALIGMGVEAARMSYRGLGEWVPESEGDHEEALSTNRRVLFDVLISPEDATEAVEAVAPVKPPEDKRFDEDWEELP